MSNDAQGAGEPIEITSCDDVLAHVFEFLDHEHAHHHRYLVRFYINRLCRVGHGDDGPMVKLHEHLRGLPGQGSRRLDVPAVTPRTRFVDREADPFRVVPEALVAWLPSRPGALLPLMTAMAAVLAITAGAGCLAAFWLQKR